LLKGKGFFPRTPPSSETLARASKETISSALVEFSGTPKKNHNEAHFRRGLIKIDLPIYDCMRAPHLTGSLIICSRDTLML